MVKNCLVCNKEFYVKPFRIKTENGKFCSRKCYGISKIKEIKCICKQCKKVFFRNPSKVGKFCSYKCSGIIRKNRIKRTCLYCKNTFEIKVSGIKRNRGKFCSKKCCNFSKIKGRKFSHGYILIYKPNHKYSHRGYIPEHRFVIEKIIGRYLKPDEEVHHLRERTNNRPHRLMAFISGSAHKRFERDGIVKPEEIIFDGRN
jgi:hypothetical protein